MNIKASKDELLEMLLVYFIETSNDEARMIQEGTIIHTPFLDEFLVWLNNRSLGDMRFAYNKLNGKNKAKYKVMKKKLSESREAILIL